MHGHPLISFTRRTIFVSDPWSSHSLVNEVLLPLHLGAPSSVLRTGTRTGPVACFAVEESRQHGAMSLLALGILWAKR